MRLITVVSFLALMIACSASGSPTVDEVLATEVQLALKVPDNGTGLIDAMKMLREVAEAPPQGRAKKLPTDFWRRLCNVVLTGTESGARIRAELARTTVSEYRAGQNDKDWRYGEPRLFGPFVIDMPKVARDAHARGDVDLARQIANCYFVLNANGGSCGNPPAIRVLVNDTEFANIAGLTDSQKNAMLGAVAKFNDQTTEALLVALRTVGPVLDSLIAADPKDDLNLNDCGLVADTLFNALNNTGGQVYFRWKSYNVLWRLNCLAKSRSDDAAIQRVRVTVDKLKQRQDAFAAELKWAEQVLSVSGKEPTNSGIGNLSGPDALKPKP